MPGTITRPSLKWYVRLVVAAGAAVIVHSAVSLPGTPHLMMWGLFAVVGVLAGSFSIDIAPVKASVSVGDTFFITSAILFGPGPAAVTLALDTLILSWRKKRGAVRTAFNVAAPALSLWLAAHAFFFLGQVPPLIVSHPPLTPLILPLLCLSVVYFVINSALIAVVVGLESSQSPRAIWRTHFMWLSVGYFAAGSLALCITLAIYALGVWAVALIVPVVIVFQLTLQASFGRLEDARLHVTKVDRLYTSTVETLAMAIDAKDDVTHNHVRRVQAYSLALARALGITDDELLKAIEAAALLHDTGKLAVPEHILNKPSGLTPSEFEQMKRHVDVGANILALVDFPFPVVPIVRCHHENWDGSGYPNGVKGTDIPIGARILSVVDCFDALMSDRPYRRALTDEQAIAILVERRGKMYDPDVVDMFVRIRRDIVVTDTHPPERKEVLDQISRPHHQGTAATPTESAAVAPESAASAAASAGDDVLAFVSLARLASGSVAAADVFALATNLIGRIAPNASGAWFQLKETGDLLRVVDAFGPAAPVLRTLSIAVGDRLSGWVAAHRTVIVNSDPALDLAELAGRTEPRLKSCLSVPLCSGNKLVGVLSLYSDQVKAFTDDQGRLIQMVAPHIAQAIEAAATTQAIGAQTLARELRIVSRQS